MDASVPPVEVADDTDPLRVGRPHREVHAGDAANRHHLRAELVPHAVVRAFGEQMQVVVGEDLAELIRVDDLVHGGAFMHAEAVGELEHVAGQRHARFEQSLRMASRHRRHHRRRDELHGRGCRLHRPQNHRRTMIERDLVTAEHGEGIAARTGGDRGNQSIVGAVDGMGHPAVLGVS
jgi:hypothetical protein